jgi:hypothetical protein
MHLNWLARVVRRQAVAPLRLANAVITRTHRVLVGLAQVNPLEPAHPIRSAIRVPIAACVPAAIATGGVRVDAREFYDAYDRLFNDSYDRSEVTG